MAISATHLTTNSDTANLTTGQTYASASISPTAGALLLVATTVAFSTGTPQVTPSGLSLSFALATDGVTNATRLWDSSTKRLSVWYAITGGSPGSGAITLTTDGDTTGGQWSISEVTGVDLASPFVQVVTAATTTVTLAAFADATNHAAYGAFGGTTNGAATAGTGFTLLGTSGSGTPPRNILSEWRLGEDTGVDAGNLGTAAGIAIELRVASSGQPMRARRARRLTGVRRFGRNA
jgi:hypothetical protein